MIDADLLIVGCGGLVTEFQRLGETLDGFTVKIDCLPTALHDFPERIPDEVANRVRTARAGGYAGRILVGYADCGTSGALDRLVLDLDVERLPGAHCYELIAGQERFAELQDEEPGTFYLSDQLAAHFEHLVVPSLGIDRHPELIGIYFANYQRVVLLHQELRSDALEAAERCASLLGLPLVVETVGRAPFNKGVAAQLRTRTGVRS